MRCADCGRELEVGDRFIEGSAGDYLKREIEPEIESLMADLFGGDDSFSGGARGKIVFCEDCTKPGGDFRLETYYGEEES